jgi:hypothetical protein
LANARLNRNRNSAAQKGSVPSKLDDVTQRPSAAQNLAQHRRVIMTLPAVMIIAAAPAMLLLMSRPAEAQTSPATLPAVMIIAAAPAMLLLMSRPAEAQTSPAIEYAKHFGALGTMSVAVARTMPAEQYTFRPDPGSMTFGELISHIATTNYQFALA